MLQYESNKIYHFQLKSKQGENLHTCRSTRSLLTIPSKYGVKISGVQFSLKLSTADAA